MIVTDLFLLLRLDSYEFSFLLEEGVSTHEVSKVIMDVQLVSGYRYASDDLLPETESDLEIFERINTTRELLFELSFKELDVLIRLGLKVEEELAYNAHTRSWEDECRK